MVSKVQQFLEESQTRSGRKRAAPPGSSQGAAKQQLFLPVFLQLDHGNKEAREQLLWKMGEASAIPAVVARTFCQQHMQQPQQLDREAGRLQKDLEKLLDLHKDLLTAPTSPTLVKLDVHVALPHLECVFQDEPLWDLSAPRTACEAYVATLCNEMSLDWHAHTLIMRRMKDAIDTATQELAAGRAQVVPAPSGAAVRRSTLNELPRVVHVSERGLQERSAAQAAKQSGSGQTNLSPRKLGGLPGGDAAAAAAGIKVEPSTAPAGATTVPPVAAVAGSVPGSSRPAAGPDSAAGAPAGAPVGTASAAPAPAPAPAGPEDQEHTKPAAGQTDRVAAAAVQQQQQASSEQTSGQDMPDLPE